MSRLVHAFGAGLLFAVGLGVSGMTDGAVVIGFLDVLGGWQPALMAVMAGGIAVHMLGLWRLRSRARPAFAEAFQTPALTGFDAPLLLGAMLFGVGWGLGGYCPGPAIVSVGAGSLEAVVFVAAMGAGMALERAWSSRSDAVAEGLAERAESELGPSCG